MPVHECEKGGVAMQAKVGPTAAGRTSACPSKRGRERGRLFELGGLKLKGKSDCQIRFPLRRILRHSRRRRRQLETWTSFLSVRQSLSTARNAFLLILSPSRVRGLPLSTSAPRGGEGVQKSADFADKQSYRSADKGGRGSKHPKILRTYLMEVP